MRNSSIRARPSPRHTRGPNMEKKKVSKSCQSTTGCSINHYFAFQQRCSYNNDVLKHGSHIPAEKGMKASTLTNSPFSLRKFSGLNSCGNFQCFSSFRADERFGIIIVPWVENNGKHLPCSSNRRVKHPSQGFSFNVLRFLLWEWNNR